MAWGIGVSAGPLYYSKRLGGCRRDSSSGSAGALLLGVVLLALVIKFFWFIVAAAVIAVAGLWLIGWWGQRGRQSPEEDAE